MKKFIPTIQIWITAVLLITASAAGIRAADKPDHDRLEGRVQMVNWDSKTITVGVQTFGQGARTPRLVLFDDHTQFTYRNKAGSMDMVKQGRRVICLGNFDGNGKMTAERIDIRTVD